MWQTLVLLYSRDSLTSLSSGWSRFKLSVIVDADQISLVMITMLYMYFV